jgi:hypothetical protein
MPDCWLDKLGLTGSSPVPPMKTPIVRHEQLGVFAHVSVARDYREHSGLNGQTRRVPSWMRPGYVEELVALHP